MEKTYNINGRETKLSYVSKAEVVKAYKDASDPAVKAELADYLIGWLSWYMPKCGESKDESIGRLLEDLVNGTINSPKVVADRMARSHRYLQEQLFNLFAEYVKQLADAYDKCHYDGRNAYACECAKKICDLLEWKNYKYVI